MPNKGIQSDPKSQQLQVLGPGDAHRKYNYLSKHLPLLKIQWYTEGICKKTKLVILARYAKFENHLFWGQIYSISQLLAGCGLSQWITTWVIFGFWHTISPPARTPNNDWLNPIYLFINIEYAIPPDLKRFCIFLIDSWPHPTLHFSDWSTYWVR